MQVCVHANWYSVSLATLDKFESNAHVQLVFTRDFLVAISSDGLLYVWSRTTWTIHRIIPISSEIRAQGIWTGVGNTIVVTYGFATENTLQVWDLDVDDEQPRSKLPVWGRVRHLSGGGNRIVALSESTDPMLIDGACHTALGCDVRIETWDVNAVIKAAK